jgi:EmrB/QacA subfamily drug resistance transporter
MSNYLVFAVVSLVLLMGGISGTSVAVAFPVITSSFNAPLVLTGWVLSAYQLMVTIAMPLGGKASDAFGRRPTYMFFLSLFIVGSLLSAIAPNIELLIFFRFIQGIGGGGFMPSSAGIVAERFPHARQQAIGFFSSILPIGQIIGPNLGGWLVTVFGWRSIFWFNVPIGLIALIASAVLLRDQRGDKRQMDMAGAGLFIGFLFALLVGLSSMGNIETAMSWVLVGLLFIVSAIFMILFIRHEGKAQDPIIDLKILREKPFAAANIFNFIYGFCIFGILPFVPFYAVSVYSMSTLESGVILTPRSIGTIIMSAVVSVSLVRWGYRWPMIIGNIFIAISLLLLGSEFSGIDMLGVQSSSLVLLLLIMATCGLGIGVVAPAANNACIELMPQRVATIMGIRGMFRQSGGAIGVALTSLLLHNIGDLALGFRIVFYSVALLMLMVIPVIFAMPRSCQTPPSAIDES